MNKQYWDTVKSLARELRKNQTASEQILWKHLRNRKFYSVKFFRQHPIVYHQHGRDYFFIADFYSAEKKLVIELDGEIHGSQKDYDKQRDLIISKKGLRVLRIENELMEHSTNLVLNKIKSFL